MAIFTKRVSRMSSEQLLSPTAASVLKDKETTNVNTRAKFHLQLHLSNIMQQGLSYQIDDVVDGLWVLANGTQRWYPGRISAVNKDGTYEVKYLDGDVHKDKKSSEIRHSKNSKLSTARSNRNLDSERERDRERDRDRIRPTHDILVEPQQRALRLQMPGVGSGTASGVASNVMSSRDSGADSPHYFSFSNVYDLPNSDNFQTFNSSDVRPCLYKRPSSRSISSTPRLTGVREGLSSRALNKDPKVKAQAVVPTIALEKREMSLYLDEDTAPLTVTAPLTGSTPTKIDSGDGEIEGRGGGKSDKEGNKPSVIPTPLDLGIMIQLTEFSKSVNKKLESLNSRPLVQGPDRAPFLTVHPQRPSFKSDDSGCSGDSNESDGQTFAIPSVFPTPRTERRVEGE